MRNTVIRSALGGLLALTVSSGTLLSATHADAQTSEQPRTFKDDYYFTASDAKLEADAMAGDFRAMSRLLHKKPKLQKIFDAKAPAAAAAGDVDAAYAIYYNKIRFTKGADGNPRTANEKMAHLLPLARAGSDEAMFELANDVFSKTEAATEVIYYFSQAFEHGNGLAAYELGLLYGSQWFPKHSWAEAAKWHEKATQTVYSKYNAANSLGAIYRSGKPGVPANPEKAAYFTKLHAETGAPLSLVLTGMNYAKGVGFPQNLQEANKYFKATGIRSFEEGMKFLRAQPVYWADIIAFYSQFE